jgi:hypothetical protein
MRKYIAIAVIGAYLALMAAFVWAADAKYGLQMAAKFFAGGLVLLWVLVRALRGFNYILFGGRAPTTAFGRSPIQPPNPSSRPPRP